MLLIAWLAPALFEVIDIARPEMVCAFPSAALAGLPALLRIADPDREMTTNGQFKIRVDLGDTALPGRVVPDDRSTARDVVMRARGPDEAVYLIALRDDGTAVLRYTETERATEITAEGACSGFEPYLDRWLAS